MISQYFNGGQNEVSACRNDSLAAKLAPLSRVSIHISFGDMAEDAPAQMTVKTDLGGVTVTDLLGGMTITDLGVLPIGNAMRTSIAQRINRKGQVVGSSECGGERHAFLWQDGKMLDLGTLGGNNSDAQDINDHEQVVGYSGIGGKNHAFLWQDGKMFDLGTMGGTASRAYAINNRGQVVGRVEIVQNVFKAFLATRKFPR